MPNNVSSANADVANLMYQCGVSVNMDYSPSASSSYVIKADNAICAQNSYTTYFKYDTLTIQGLRRSDYSDAAWNAMLINDLTKGRPVQYAGQDATQGGHTWVCDGYDSGTGFYHMNWGWGGAFTAYYSLDALNPSTYDFVLQEEAIIGIQPVLPLAPVSDFTSNTTYQCGSGTINFKDQSSNVATSWSWTFSGGSPSTSTSRNPVVTYSTPGTYNVTLTASNSHGTGTPVTKTGYITIYGSGGMASSCTVNSTSLSNNYGFGIYNVTLNTINNNTGGTVSDGGYKNFSCVTNTTLLPSTTYTLNVTVGSFNPENIKAYIDYNNNGTYTDAGEMIYSASGVEGAQSTTFTTPASPTTGSYLRLRIIDDFNTISNCSDVAYGQVEDYGVYFNPSGTPPVAAFTSNKTSVCPGGSVSFTDQSTNTPTSWAWTFTGGSPSTSTSQNPSVTYSTAGTYSVSLVATNASGSNTHTVAGYITVTANPTATASSAGVSCNGGANGSASVSAGSGTAPYTYAWSNGATGSTASSLSASTYTVTVTDSKGCVATSTATVAQPSALTVSLTPTNTSSCGGSDGSISSSVSGGTSAYTYAWQGGGTASTKTALAAGTYSLTVTDAHGCTKSNSASVSNGGCTSSQLTATYCGATLASMTQTISSVTVANTIYYSYHITNASIGYSYDIVETSNLSLGDVPGLSAATTYTVQVKPYAGGVWGSYGSSCTITTPGVPSTQLSATYCGATLASMTQTISCNPVVGAFYYTYHITNVSLGYTYDIVSTTNLSLSNVPGLQPATTYNVQVKALVGSAWGSLGSVCTITTPAIPTTQLAASYCGATLTSLTQTIGCNAVAGAVYYTYHITNAGLGFSYDLVGPSSVSLSPVNGLLYGTTYNVQVKALVGNAWGSYSTTCTITMPSSPAGTTKLSSGYCGSTVSSSSQSIYCDLVTGANYYRFRVKDAATGGSVLNQVYVRTFQPANAFTLSAIPGIQVGTAYTVEVSYLDNSGVWSSYGAVCTVTTTGGYSVMKNNNNHQPGMLDEEMVASVEMYPNPLSASDKLNISVSGMNIASDHPATLQIFDMLGNEFVRVQLTNPVYQLDIPANTTSGVYFVNVICDDKKVTKRFIVR